MISAKSLAAMSLLEHFIWFTFSCFSCVYISLIKYFQWNEHTLKQINSQSIYTYYIIHIHHIKRWNDWIRTISRVKMPYIYIKLGPSLLIFPRNRKTDRLHWNLWTQFIYAQCMKIFEFQCSYLFGMAFCLAY